MEWSVSYNSFVKFHGKKWEPQHGHVVSKSMIRRSVIKRLHCNSMGGSFQDHSWIQDFEADFPMKVSLKILN